MVRPLPAIRGVLLSSSALLCGIVSAPGCGEVRADAVVLGPDLAMSTGGRAAAPTPTPALDGQGGAIDSDPEPDPDDELEPPASAGELCSPCRRSSQCGGEGDYCLSLRNSEDNYCGSRCDADGGCPEGYECIALRNAPEIEQCAPVRRRCPP